jgi:hypothetical protein
MSNLPAAKAVAVARKNVRRSQMFCGIVPPLEVPGVVSRKPHASPSAEPSLTDERE